MTKINTLLCLVAATFAQNVEDPLVEFAKGNAKFSADVLKVVFTDHYNKGIISPLSVQLILALTAEGAKGETYDQLKKALNLPDRKRTNQAVKALMPLLNKSSKNFNMSLAEKLYVGVGFKMNKDFETIAVEDYKSDVQNVNFAVSHKTTYLTNKEALLKTRLSQLSSSITDLPYTYPKSNNTIRDLLHPNQLNVTIRLLLVNTLYLNGKWETPFPLLRTTNSQFYYLDNSESEVETMHSTSSYLYQYSEYLQAKFLEIPFKESNVSVTFILPDKRDGIVELYDHVELFLEPHNLTRQTVDVNLPKFSTSTYHDFKDVVSKLGATDVFSKIADLSGISDEDLYISFVQQKASINITEAGTEPAAPLSAGVVPIQIWRGTKQPFNADHPFFYYIRESRSQTLLFVGCFQ